jgi:hypothetical protein
MLSSASKVVNGKGLNDSTLILGPEWKKLAGVSEE